MIVVAVTLSSDDEWERFVEIWREKDKGPMTIRHPFLANYDITHVVCVGASLPEDGEKSGTKVVRLRFVEWRTE